MKYSKIYYQNERYFLILCFKNQFGYQEIHNTLHANADFQQGKSFSQSLSRFLFTTLYLFICISDDLM